VSTFAERGRNSAIDTAKGIGILLVVFGHTQLVLREKGELFRIIYSVHLPLFLALSGVFLSVRRPFFEFLAGKVKTILVPYLLIGIGCIFYQATIGGGGHLARDLFRLFWASSRTMPYGWLPVWFLPHLFVVVGFSYLVIRVLQRRSAPIWVYVLVAALFLICGKLILVDAQSIEVGSWSIGRSFRLKQLPAWPFTMNALFVSSGFVLSGYLMKDKILSASFDDFNLFALSLIVFSGLHIAFDYSLDLNLGVYDHLVISSIEALSGTYLVIYAASKIDGIPFLGRWLRFLGERSLYIMAFHSIGGLALIGILIISEGGTPINVFLHSGVAIAGGLALSISVHELKIRIVGRSSRNVLGAK
jgi:fucose 4-O-acetylase-like acetyltransferase